MTEETPPDAQQVTSVVCTSGVCLGSVRCLLLTEREEPDLDHRRLSVLPLGDEALAPPLPLLQGSQVPPGPSLCCAAHALIRTLVCDLIRGFWSAMLTAMCFPSLSSSSLSLFLILRCRLRNSAPSFAAGPVYDGRRFGALGGSVCSVVFRVDHAMRGSERGCGATRKKRKGRRTASAAHGRRKVREAGSGCVCVGVWCVCL